MRARPDWRLSRRAFFKFGAAAAAVAAGLVPGPAGLPAIVSTLPLPYPHTYIPDPDALLRSPAAAGGDLWLVPAYAAAALIRQGALHDLARERFGVSGRPHDPEGSFTRPHTQARGALLTRGSAPRSWAEAWQGGVVWPRAPRLTLGAALLRRGYSPNDTHAGHLAQIEQDLLEARPSLAAKPEHAARQNPAAVAFALVPASAALEPGLRAAWPAEGTLAVDFDWVIPRHALRPGAALAFLRQAPWAGGPPASLAHALPAAAMPGRLAPLMPLPAEAQAQRDALWARLCARLWPGQAS